jgi:hypothetical protein
MGRKAATIEYLEKLVQWSGGKSTFCEKAGVQSSNLNAYLAGTKPISWKRLESATRHVFGEPPAFVPIIEGHNYTKDGFPPVSQLPKEPGIYALFDSAMRVIYYGRATKLYDEVRQTLNRPIAEVRPWSGKKDLQFKDITAYLSAFRIVRADATFIHDLESFGLHFLVNNTFNKNGGTFTRTQ